MNRELFHLIKMKHLSLILTNSLLYGTGRPLGKM